MWNNPIAASNKDIIKSGLGPLKTGTQIGPQGSYQTVDGNNVAQRQFQVATSNATWPSNSNNNKSTTQNLPLWTAADKAAYDASYDNYQNNINNHIVTDAQSWGRGVEDWNMNARKQQSALDNKGAQNELARNQGRTGILDKVNQGVRSAGIMLGNRNAGSSSAGAAIASAYGQIGNRDMQKVEQGYQVNNDTINSEQQLFNENNQTQTRRLEEDKANTINAIIADAERSMMALNSQATTASLPDRMNIEAEKNRIRSEAAAKLQAYDGKLAATKALGGGTLEQRRSKALELQNKGMAAEQPFATYSDANVAMQDQSPSGGNLPIYVNPRRQQLGL